MSMLDIVTITDVSALISNGVDESTILEYKSGIDISNDSWKKEIAKDVSAMANANGGMIIYGVKEFDDSEKRHLPEKITPIDSSKVSMETIMQVINSNITPKISNLDISCLVVDAAKPNEVVYVVRIPQSSTAHQNLKTKQYHKRYGTTVNAMEDYEIRDVMNRKVHPDINLDFEIKYITRQELYWSQPTYNPLTSFAPPVQPQVVPIKQLVLNCIPNNNGQVVAEHVHYFIHLPISLLAAGQEFDIATVKDWYATIRRENIYCDILDGSTVNNVQYGNPRIVPILPNMTGVHKAIYLQSDINLNPDTEIRWTLHADGAPMKFGKIRLGDIVRR